MANEQNQKEYERFDLKLDVTDLRHLLNKLEIKEYQSQKTGHQDVFLKVKVYKDFSGGSVYTKGRQSGTFFTLGYLNKPKPWSPTDESKNADLPW